ncbi:DUF3124 domain-containing protein [Shimia abyssi]|uniref:Uncharacterized protein DUF3124 n=1 Tax=Shimia abyssi TaxID=1662395 RepID=A0A2P8FDR7_9RHOB|nr:DUF3124 domain-containing protein [Shimia abyssi]PSL19818.1 uncharacterized protein DUF3124 [Shimia abyssi]
MKNRAQLRRLSAKNLTAMLSIVLFCSAKWALAQEVEPFERLNAQTLFVPGYSEVLTHEGASEPLASTLYVHNVDPEQSISVLEIEYLDTEGALVKRHLEEPAVLSPFQSTRVLVPIGSTQNTHGGNFVVKWEAENAVLQPIVEALIVGGKGTQGISFISKARVLSQR